MLAQSVGVDLADVQRMLIGGSFGQYINVEKAVQIGLLPDLPAPARAALRPGTASSSWATRRSAAPTWLCCAADVRAHLTEIAGKMTYLELSADNSFYDAFTSALFLPHTDLTLFPSVETTLGRTQRRALQAAGLRGWYAVGDPWRQSSNWSLTAT